MTYKVFKRTCKNWQEFARARKITIATGLDYAKARDLCEEYNKERTKAQIRNGTVYEFISE